MATLPTAGSFSFNPGVNDNSDMGPRFEDWLAFTRQLPGGNVEAALTISNGRVVADRTSIRLDTQGAAATDDLDGIGGTLPAGSWIKLRITDAARKITLKHLTGAAGERLFLRGSVDFQLTSSSTTLWFEKSNTQWLEQARFYGDDNTAERANLGLGNSATRNIASAAQADAAAVDTVVLTPASIVNQIPKSSSQLTIGPGVAGTWAHGLGTIPRRFWGVLVFLTAQAGYSIGQEVIVSPLDIMLSADATNIYYVVNDDGISLLNRTNGTTAAASTSNCRLVIRATK